jgi:hypothetical protein
MRARNIVLLVCVWLAAIAAYTIITLAGQIWFSPRPFNGQIHVSPDVKGPIHYVASFVVLTLSGAVLCRFIDSPVPLKWCLGLGLTFAVIHMAPGFLVGPPIPAAYNVGFALLLNAAITIAYALLPVIGGYFVKRRGNRG